MAIPVTVNVVLILSDCLLVWATAFKSRLLLLPWMAMHALEFGLFVALLVYLMIYLVEPWVKVTERQSINTINEEMKGFWFHPRLWYFSLAVPSSFSSGSFGLWSNAFTNTLAPPNGKG